MDAVVPADQATALLGTDRPPMIPLISRQPEFLYATDVELSQYAKNNALVGQVIDSLKCWISHIREIEERREESLDTYDRMEELSIVRLRQEMVQYEKDTAFYVHFEREEVVACMKLLRLVKEDDAQFHMKILEEKTALLIKYHTEASNALQYIEHLHSLLVSLSFANEAARTASQEEDGCWHMADCTDALPPLFSALRATWVCCDLFGSKSPPRYTSIIRWLVQRVQTSVQTGCGTCIMQLIENPRNANKIKEILVAAQDACVSVQEQFHDLRQQLSESGVLLGSGVDANSPEAVELHTIFFDIDDDVLFATIEWQFHRLTETLVVVDALMADTEKIGSALTDPIAHVDLLDADAMDQPTFYKHVTRIVEEKAPSANAILERMGVKANPSKTLVAKIPFESLTSSLILNVQFNPPAVTIVGGPLSQGAMEAATATLPATCTNANVMSLRRSMAPPQWREIAPKIMHMEIANQFCEPEISQTMFLLTLMDIVESEDAWKMTDTHASQDNGLDRFMLHFRKHRSTKGKAAGDEVPAIEGATQQQVAAIEATQ